ncbi:MAG: Y-family DNA polymerase [Bacteroidota bacterium]
MFALVDCNNFYASCERVFRPELNGKPVVVLSNNDGCVIARSNEAKEVGVPMGAPAFKYEELFKQKNVHVFSANFELYGDLSNRIMTLLQDFCPEIEIYSIDEAFMKLEGYEYFDLNTHFQKMQEDVSRSVGIPISVGVAPTKALSKVAAEIVKKFPQKTKGLYIIDTEEKRIKALKWMKIERVWGVGRRFSKKLRQVGVITAYDFTQLSDNWVYRHMTTVGLRLKKDLLGIPTLDLDDIKPKRHIATTRTFEKKLKSKQEIQERISTFAVFCAEKLRKQKGSCQALMVFIQASSQELNYSYTGNSLFVKLPFATNSSLELVSFANKAIDKLFEEGKSYTRGGVIIMDFVPESEIQLSLFENSNPRHKKLMSTIDKMNNLYGQQKIRLAVQDQKRIWKMKQEKLSPKYTTKMEDILTIHAK